MEMNIFAELGKFFVCGRRLGPQLYCCVLKHNMIGGFLVTHTSLANQAPQVTCQSEVVPGPSGCSTLGLALERSWLLCASSSATGA